MQASRKGSCPARRAGHRRAGGGRFAAVLRDRCRRFAAAVDFGLEQSLRMAAALLVCPPCYSLGVPERYDWSRGF